jgi:hypothetical protein
MMSRFKRLGLAAVLAFTWALLSLAILQGVGYLLGDTFNLDWVGKVALFPFSVLGWLEVKLTEAVGVPGPGHLVLTTPWRALLLAVALSIHFGFFTLVAYVLLSWKARAQGQRLGGRA